jgi:GNAT superfamily N-acetyltransferase
MSCGGRSIRPPGRTRLATPCRGLPLPVIILDAVRCFACASAPSIRGAFAEMPNVHGMPSIEPSDPSARDIAEHAAVRIVPYSTVRDDHRIAFRDLNLAWIEAHFAVEARDRHELDDPEGHIERNGGQIFVAEVDGPEGVEVLGVCALLVEPDGALELAKMAVRDSARGRGVGRLLGEAAIAAARARGAQRIDLLSNTALAPAIALYRALGFIEVPLPATDYARANIKMVLELDRTPSAD